MRRLPIGKLGLFIVVGALSLTYILVGVIGPKALEGNYRVVVDMPVTGGLFPGSQVTYRGVPIGTVSSIDITSSGVAANLDIHDSVHIPVATKAVVADRSPAGEQYIDMEPTGAGPPYLTDGSVIMPQDTVQPPSLAALLNSISAFSHSVDLRQLRTVVNQLAVAFSGTGPALGALLDHSAQLVASLVDVEPRTIDLLHNAGALLDTQLAHDSDLRSFAVSLRQLSDTIRADDPRTAQLISDALETTEQVAPILVHDSHDIAVLLTNLVTTGRIAVARLPGLKALLFSLPAGLHALASAVHGGHVDFLLLDQPGTFCSYPGTRRRAPFNAHKGAPITNGYCLHPLPIQDQRGAVYEPRPPGDDTASPPGKAGSWHGIYTTGTK